MRTPLNLLRRQIYLALGVSPLALALAGGCIDGGPHDDPDTDTDTDSDTDTDTDTDTDPIQFETCSDVPVLTAQDIANWTSGLFLVCGPQHAGGTCPDAATLDGTQYIADQFGPGNFSGWVQCGPADSHPDECCYEMDIAYWVDGRPFTVDGQVRVAEVCSDSEWGASLTPSLDHLSEADRAIFAQTWLQAGLMEHASIASFSRFILELLSLGAPPELVAGANRALQDEIVHARLAFGLAQAADTFHPGPGRLPVADALGHLSNDQAIVVGAIVEGCINETISAARAMAAAQSCTDPVVRRVLERIAQDESRHAALAWRFARWALQNRPDLTSAVAQAFAQYAHPMPENNTGTPSQALQELGLLTEDQLQSVTLDTLTKVVLPSAAMLLGNPQADCDAASAIQA